MAFTTQNMAEFSKRIQNFCTSFQSQIEEALRLDEIYINETVSGANVDFVDTDIATEQEHVDMIVFMRALSDFRNGGEVDTLNRISNLTPFLQ